MEIFVLRDGQQTGPFNEDTVQTLFQRGSLTAVDMAWRKGLPTWMPLGEVLNPGSERPSSPPPTPVSSGIRPAPRKGASAKQKALLKYIGATFEDDITKEEAALALSDALENPKLASRFQKWAEEKLRLHPDIFQDEIDQRRAHRVLRYLELCQTEAAEMVNGVTKAHVQVLVESLDKKNSTWERDSRTALWDHLLPAIAEHFPQLVRDGWKSKLKAGSPSKVAASIAADELPPEPAAPGPFSAALRGLVYGGVVLLLIVGGMQLFKHSETTPAKDAVKSGTPANPGATAPTAPAPSGTPAAPAIPALAATPLEIPAAAPGINAEANAAVPEAGPGVAAIPMIPPAPAPGASTPTPADPTMAAAGTPPPAATANPGIPLNTPPTPPAPNPPTPAPNPAATTNPAASTNPVPTTPPEPGPATPAPPSGVKNLLTVTKPVQVQLQFGKVTLNAGTRVRFIALEGGNVRVNFNNNVILVPAVATDVDPNALPPAQAAPQLPPPPTLTQPTPPKPAGPTTPAVPKPSSDL